MVIVSQYAFSTMWYEERSIKVLWLCMVVVTHGFAPGSDATSSDNGWVIPGRNDPAVTAPPGEVASGSASNAGDVASISTSVAGYTVPTRENAKRELGDASAAVLDVKYRARTGEDVTNQLVAARAGRKDAMRTWNRITKGLSSVATVSSVSDIDDTSSVTDPDCADCTEDVSAMSDGEAGALALYPINSQAMATGSNRGIYYRPERDPCMMCKGLFIW